MYALHAHDVQMPELTAKTLDDNGVDNLRVAIIAAAADHYVDMVKGYLLHPVADQTLDQYMYQEDRFFRSKWFKTLAMDRLDSECVIKALRARAREEINEKV